MKIRHSANRAIFVLESPWELDAGDANRTSVLPFIEGIGKLAGDVEVFHANFYDTSSLKKALSCLAKTHYKNAILYVASHGDLEEIGGVKTGTVLHEIGTLAESLNITGVLLGSCLAAHNTARLEVFTEGTNLRWCAGYSASVAWLEGTLLDCAILSRMLDLKKKHFDDADTIVAALAEAVAPFSRSYGIGSKKSVVRLDQAMEFVVQAKGRGKRSRSVTAEVFDGWDDMQTAEDET